MIIIVRPFSNEGWQTTLHCWGWYYGVDMRWRVSSTTERETTEYALNYALHNLRHDKPKTRKP